MMNDTPEAALRSRIADLEQQLRLADEGTSRLAQRCLELEKQLQTFYAVHRAAEDAVIRKDEIGDAAGQLARVEAEIDGGLRQLEGGRHHPVHLVVFVVRGFDGVPLGKAEAGIEVEQRLHQRR